MEFEIGQTLYFVATGNYMPREMAITEIGRKWLHCERGNGSIIRVNRETLVVHTSDGGGRVYLSLDEYKNARLVSDAWQALRRDFGYYAPPRGVTLDKIQQARALLFGEGGEN